MLEHDLISKETLLNFPRLPHLGRYLCSLIINDRISITEVQTLTGRQIGLLDDDNVHDLILSDIATIPQIYRLTSGQLYQLSQSIIYDRVATGALSLENIPNEMPVVSFNSFFSRVHPEAHDGTNPNFSMQ